MFSNYNKRNHQIFCENIALVTKKKFGLLTFDSYIIPPETKLNKDFLIKVPLNEGAELHMPKKLKKMRTSKKKKNQL